jgi:DeoR family fructose operon transcriptional repressor
MYATERQDAIADALHASGRVSVADLATSLDVTTETVRRDLDALEAAGVLRRVHGGAVPAGRVSVAETSVAEREGQHGAAKTAIADAAMRLLPPTFTGSVAIDAGTTCAAVAARIADWEPATAGQTMTVITNSVPIAAVLQHSPHIELHLLGGRVRGVTSAAVGTATVEQIAALRPDIAFVGTNGLSAGFGLSTPDEYEAAVKGAYVVAARRAVVVVDATKHGVEALMRFATVAEIDTIVTDAQPAADLAGALAEADVEVIVA